MYGSRFPERFSENSDQLPKTQLREMEDGSFLKQNPF